jgi:predicted transcriptional regulator
MEMYLAVIKVLDNAGALAQQQILRKAGITTDVPKEFFGLLLKLNIIKEIKYGSKTMYSLTEKGQRLHTFFGLDDDRSILNDTGLF